MSEYSEYSYDYGPRVANEEVAEAAGIGTLLREAADQLGNALMAAGTAAVELGSTAVSTVSEMSRRFEEQAAALEREGVRSPLEVRLAALDNAPLLRAAVQAEVGFAPDALCKATDGLQRFEAGLRGANHRLMVAEATVLHRHLTGALKDLGYTLRQPRRPVTDQVLVRAEKAEGTAVTMKLSPRSGRLELDLSGFNGDTCLREQERLLDNLRRRRVLLTQRNAQRHAAPTGGVLTREVDALLGATRKSEAGTAQALRQK